MLGLLVNILRAYNPLGLTIKRTFYADVLCRRKPAEPKSPCAQLCLNSLKYGGCLIVIYFRVGGVKGISAWDISSKGLLFQIFSLR